MLKPSEIKENSVLMIEFEDGREESFFVNRKKIGHLTRKTRLLGDRLSNLIANPKLYPCNAMNEKQFYAGSEEEPDAKQAGVSLYRRLTKIEKEKLIGKIKPIKGLEKLIDVISKS